MHTTHASKKMGCRKGGRPPKWTPEVAFALGVAFGRGRSWSEAAKEAGIGKSTLNRWFRRGMAGDDRFAPLVARMKAVRNPFSIWF
jgi:hypothetical protein